MTEAINKIRIQYKEQRSRIADLDKERTKLQGERRTLEEQIRLFHNQELLQKQIEYLTMSGSEYQYPGRSSQQRLSLHRL